MKSIQLIKYGKAENAFQFVDANIPEPQSDEVQIQVECFGLNYADVMARQGMYREAPPLPCVLGYEVVGKIIKVGKDASQDLLHKRVVAFTRFGGYSQLVNTQCVAVVEIGDYDGEKALCLATQYVTAYYMSHVATTLNEDDNILIHAAAGGVGTALIQLLRDKKVNIIAKIGSEAKTEYLKQQGVKNIVNYRNSDYAEQVKAILKDEKLDVSFNPAGGGSFKKDWKLIGPAGTILLFGGSERSGKKMGILSDLNFVRKMGVIIPITLMGSSRGIIGVNMLRIADHKPKVLLHCLEKVVELAQNGTIDPQVSSVFPAKDIAKAHALLQSGKTTGKVALKW